MCSDQTIIYSSKRVGNSAVECGIADPEVTGSIPVRPLLFGPFASVRVFCCGILFALRCLAPLLRLRSGSLVLHLTYIHAVPSNTLRIIESRTHQKRNPQHQPLHARYQVRLQVYSIPPHRHLWPSVRGGPALSGFLQRRSLQ